MSKRKPTYLDLFAGAGGLSEGFQKLGYIDIAHVEMNSDACNTLKTRSIYYYLKQQDNLNLYYEYLKGKVTRTELYNSVPNNVISSVIEHTISEATMNQLYGYINNIKREKRIRKIDIIIGGPPCQAYSLVGRARSDDSMKSDPRNLLYLRYCDIVNYYKPKMFVFENVPGLYTAGGGKYYSDLKSKLDDIGYEVMDHLINFEDYGLLQNRRRVILIGWKRGSGKFYPDFKKVSHNYTLNDLFSDLPIIHPNETNNEYKTSSIPEYLSKYGIRKENDVLTLNSARTLNNHDAEIYKRVIEAWNKDNKRLKYTDLPENLWTHNNRECFLDRFKVIASNLSSSQTIVAHLSKDGHYFIHPDIEQCRSITVREAARIQSFPDDYYFEGNRSAQFIQVGNAVPPIISEMIAKELLKQL